MASIARSDLQALGSSVTTTFSITDVTHLSSYNWIEAAEPTIAVPGSPPLWTPPKTPKKIPQDSGFVYISQNAARHPDSPLEPLFRSLFHTNPTFDISSVDVITDRNNIRKLLYFVNPKLDKYGAEPFAIKAEVVGKTIIFSREEAATYEIIQPNEFRGFGHNFEKLYTSTEIAGSTGHHRVISYSFGGLKFVVRHETDGYVKTLPSPDDRPRQTQDEAILSRMMDTLSVSPTTVGHVITGSKLSMCHVGKEVPIESTLEIKTRAMTRRLEIADVAAQLWVSQTPRLARAYHNKGTFQKPQVEDITAEVKAWESDHEEDLKRLGGLIQKIVSIARECAGSVAIKYDVSRDQLQIEKTAAAPTLPEDLYSRWDNTGTNTTQPARNGHERITDTHSSRPKRLDDVPFSKVIQIGVDKGFRHIFRNMPENLADYQELCRSMKRLGTDVLQGRQIRSLMSDMRLGKDDYDPEERRTFSMKSIARDSAFRLLYLFLDGAVSDRNMAYEATLFVVSHARIFKHKTRKMVLEAFNAQFVASDKQRRILDQWQTKWDSSHWSNDLDVTTDECESDFSFDSFNSF
ncbi:unnamed protein product [Clonostachys chloroleuca]|uniref:Geranylgeranyl pyrophosphate synthetase n=1 Tax=Clonostachys chloroleuca TaxID=1926264 RepID=A0AA35Q1F8_9HYPO|nr:unnamed protein product [Clonostachys chloroleuca]